MAQQGDGPSALDGLQLEAGPGSIVEDAEDRLQAAVVPAADALFRRIDVYFGSG